MEERERAYLEALVSLRDRSALFDAVNQVIPRSTFGILGLRSEKPRSRTNRGRGAAPAFPTTPSLTPEDQAIADRDNAALREADEIIRQAKGRKFALTASKKDSARLISVQQSIATNLNALVDLSTRPKPHPNCPDVLPSVKDLLKGHIADCQHRLEEQKQKEAKLKPASAPTPTIYVPKCTQINNLASQGDRNHLHRPCSNRA